MTIRASALRWLCSRNVSEGHVVASKFYMPDESWTKDKAWWIQIPLFAVEFEEMVHILCQSAPRSAEFRHLQVPASFLAEHRNDFAMIGDDKINLFLTATRGSEFRDLRGPGKISFARFEQGSSK
jgi:hypothetical protein